MRIELGTSTVCDSKPVLSLDSETGLTRALCAIATGARGNVRRLLLTGTARDIASTMKAPTIIGTDKRRIRS